MSEGIKSVQFVGCYGSAIEGLLAFAARCPPRTLMPSFNVRRRRALPPAVAEILPVAVFYLKPAVGGRTLPYSFWRRFAEIENVVAIKLAPFNRCQPLEVVRAVAEAGPHRLSLD